MMLKQNGHLNEESIAFFAEGLIDSDVYKLIPGSMLDHVDECLECKQKVFDLFEIIRHDEETKAQIRIKHHPKALKSKVDVNLKRKQRNLKTYLWLVAAASVIILIGIYLVLKSNQGNQSERLFVKYFSPYQNLLTMKGESGNLLDQAMYFYDIQLWDSALVYFKKIAYTESNRTAVQFYYGNALLAVGKASEAEKQFISVIQEEDERFLIQSQWYLALTYLETGNTKKTINILNDLAANEGIFGLRARELLSKIQ